MRRRRTVAAGLAGLALALSACDPGGTFDGAVDGVVDVGASSDGATAGASDDTADDDTPADAPGAPASADDPLSLPVPAADTWTGRVVRIADGDTFTVEVVDPGATGHGVGDRLRIRLLRIDTPELAHNGQPEQCWAQEATAILASLAPLGSVVTLAHDTERVDQYDRELAHAWNQAGHWVNGELLDRGAAEVLTYRPNVAHTDRVEALEAEARAAGRGRWSACPA